MNKNLTIGCIHGHLHACALGLGIIGALGLSLVMWAFLGASFFPFFFLEGGQLMFQQYCAVRMQCKDPPK